MFLREIDGDRDRGSKKGRERQRESPLSTYTRRGREGGSKRERWRRGSREAQAHSHPLDLCFLQRKGTAPSSPSSTRGSGQELGAGIGLPVAGVVIIHL